MSTIICTVDGCDRPVSDAYVCGACLSKLEIALADVRWLDDQLDVVLTRQTARSAGGRVSGDREHPLPYDQRASSARWVLTNTVTTWARVVDEEEPRANIPMLAGLYVQAAWLASWSGFFRTHQAGHEAVEELTAAVSQARRVVDIRPERWYAGPCDECATDLYARAGAARVVCPNEACAHEYDAMDRRGTLLAAAEDRLANAALIARAVTVLGRPVDDAKIRQWAARGRIVAKSTDHKGRPLYRVGDVLDLAADDGARGPRRAG